MLFKLSLNNIKKSFKDYAIYFFTLILGVAVFYVFNAIEDQTIFLNVSKYTYDIITLMNRMLEFVSVFVSFILGFLIIYASRFLIKRRNKEFGTYMILGMSKGKISKILLFETIMIGFISLVVGLILGVILSQVMSILVANMFEADLTKFAFVISKDAIIKTIIYFAIMYLLVMIFNTISVSKCKLIDLLYSSKKSEQVKIKNPYICIIIFIIASTMLGYAYYLVTIKVTEMINLKEVVKPVLLGVIGTFLIIWSLSGLILKIVMSLKNLYFNKLNSFTLRQLSSKINTTVFSMTIVCLMLFITICTLSSSLSLKNSMTANLKELAPVDIQFMKNLDLEVNDDYGYTFEEVENSKYLIKEDLEKLNFDIDENLKDVIDINLYATNDVLVKDTLGSYYEISKKKYPMLMYDMAETFIKLSDYNKIAKLYGNKTYNLKENEYIIIADFDSWKEIRDESLKNNTSINLLGKTYYPKYKECEDGFIYISSNHINTGIFIVPDDAVNESIRAENVITANYKANNKEGKQKIEDKINDIDPDKEEYKGLTLSASSKIAIYAASVGLGAMVTFIGIYLGIIFMITSAALLALKELSESTDNKERFNVLRKIGTDEKLINKALFRQILIFFAFPLVLSIIHSIFGIIFCNYLLETFGDSQLLKSIIMTAIFLVIIYGGYFIITYLCSKNIIKNR